MAHFRTGEYKKIMNKVARQSRNRNWKAIYAAGVYFKETGEYLKNTNSLYAALRRMGYAWVAGSNGEYVWQKAAGGGQ